MGLFDIFGEVVKVPGSVIKDVIHKPNDDGIEDTNIGQRLSNIGDDISDIFD